MLMEENVLNESYICYAIFICICLHESDIVLWSKFSL